MVTAIIMAPIKTDKMPGYPVRLPLLLLALNLTGVASVMAAEVQIKPAVTASGYGFWLRQDETGGGLDKGLAALLSPTLGINATGKQLSSALSLKNESVWYDDSQRSHKSLSSYNWRSQLTALDERFRVGLSASSAHRIRNSQAGVFSDIITGSDNLSKTSSLGANLGLSTGASADVYSRLGLDYRRLRSDTPELDDGIGNFANDAYTTTLAMGSADRQSALFWQASGSYRKTDRESGESFTAKQAAATGGVPLYRNLSAIVRGSYDNNEAGRSYNNEFVSYGAGLEYKIGRASRISVSRNRAVITSNSSPDLEVRETYTAAEVFLAPSRRTSLSYTLDRRYTGRTAVMQGSYQLRFLSLRLSLSDTVQTLSTLDEVTEDLGIFVCPDTAAQFSDCFRPPTNNYQLQTGESFRQLFGTELELSEQIINRRSASFAAGYNRNRLALNLLVSRSEDDYVESGRQSERDTISLQSSWQLTPHASLLLNARYYDIDYGTEQRADKNLSLEGGIKYQLNSRADVSAMFRRIERDSTLASRDISEDRVWLSLSQRF